MRAFHILSHVLVFCLVSCLAQASVCPEAESETNADKKIQLYTKCIDSGKLAPVQLGTAYFERGNAYGNAEALQKAIDDFSMCIKLRPTFISGYYNRARAYTEQGNFEKALADVNLLMRSLADAPQIINLRANTYKAMKRYDDAIKDYTRAIQIQLGAKKIDKKDLADTYNARGLCHLEKKDWANSKKDIDAAIILQPNGTNYYNTRGVFYLRQQNNEKAKEDFQQAIKLDPNNKTAKENLSQLGKPDASPMDTMAMAEHEAHVLIKKGDYAQAIEKLKVALKYGEKVFNDNLLGYESIMVVLANLYDKLSQYDASLPLHKALLQFTSEVYGTDASRVTPYISDLATVYGEIGDAEKAREMRAQALAIEEAAFEPSLQNMAGELHNLAMSELDLGDFESAKKHLDRAYALKKRILGDDDLATILTKLGFASYYQKIGQYDKAEKIYLQEADLLRQIDGPHSKYLAQTYMNLAAIRERSGDSDSAGRYVRQAIDMQQHVLGSASAEVAGEFQELAKFSAKRGEYQDALGSMLHAQGMLDNFIDRILSFTTEKQQLLLLSSQQQALQELFSLVVGHLAADPNAVRQSFDIWLRRKGLVLETQKQFQNALLSSKDPQVSKRLEELRTVRANISYSLIAGPRQDQSEEEHQATLQALEKRKQALEADIASKSQTVAANFDTKSIRSETITRLLPKGSVMVEFVRTSLPPLTPNTGEPQPEPPVHYLAFVLPAGNLAGLTLVDLGDADRIEAAQAKLRRILDHSQEAPPEAPETADAVERIVNRLYELTFAPLRQAIGEARQIYLSPDGALNLLPFEVLRDDSGRFLIEDFSFTYLTAGRDIARFGAKQGPPGKNLIIGNPDFDLTPKAKEKVLQDLRLTRGTAPVQAMTSQERLGLYFKALPGTQKEVDAIRRIVGSEGSEFYTGKAAVEELLASHTSPAILHLATHGFFLPDQQLPRAASTTPGPKTAAGNETVFENPLVRSGIALAGANGALASEKATGGDGLVTAEKVLGLNLLGTRLVVLSACESGVGEIRSGEGVFGLRRAFMQAGAKGQIMSMWPIPDDQTRDLMSDFYGRIQADAANLATALRQAALDMLQATRKRYGHGNPFFWGAFVFLGDDGTITTPVGTAKAAPTMTPASNTAGISITRHEDIRRFMEDFFNARSQNDSEKALEFYADRVDFFKENKANKATIKKSLDYYATRWPVRNTLITGMSIGFHQDTELFEVTVSYNYSTKNSSSQKQGTANDTFFLKQKGIAFSIVSEKNVSIQRQ